MIFPSTYTEAIEVLKKKDEFMLSVRKDLRTGNIEGIEIEYSPLLRDTGVLKVKELLGESFSVNWMGIGERNNYILVKLK